jgi:hypothetical protein
MIASCRAHADCSACCRARSNMGGMVMTAITAIANDSPSAREAMTARRERGHANSSSENNVIGLVGRRNRVSATTGSQRFLKNVLTRFPIPVESLGIRAGRYFHCSLFLDSPTTGRVAILDSGRKGKREFGGENRVRGENRIRMISKKRSDPVSKLITRGDETESL